MSVATRSTALGAARAFDDAIDWDQPVLLGSRPAEVLSTVVDEDRGVVGWWFGAVVEAEDVASATAATLEILPAVSLTSLAVRAVGSLGLEADEDADRSEIPGARSPHRVPKPIGSLARRGGVATLHWTSGVTRAVQVSSSPTAEGAVILGITEEFPPVADDIGEALVLKHHHLVVRLDDTPADATFIDRYDGRQLPRDGEMADDPPVAPFELPPPTA